LQQRHIEETQNAKTEVEANREWENAVSANVNERNRVFTKADERNAIFVGVSKTGFSQTRSSNTRIWKPRFSQTRLPSSRIRKTQFSQTGLSIYIGYKHRILKMLENIGEILGNMINIDII